jgi:hypothetical protein
MIPAASLITLLVYRNSGLPLASAAQYMHPRISVAIGGPSGNIAERLERLILEQRKKPKLIEHAPLIRRRI